MRNCFYKGVSILVFLIICFVSVRWVYASSSVEIRVWHMENIPQRVEIFQGIIDRFNEQNPGIKLKQEVLVWGTAREKIMAAVRAKVAPEMLFTIPDLTIMLRKTGAVTQVDEIVAELDEKYEFQSSALKPYHQEGHYWSIPNYSMVKILWYRKDLFRKAGLDPNTPPRTWNELLDCAKTISENLEGVYGIGIPASKHLDTDQEIYTFMVTNRAEDIFDETGKVVFDNPRTVEAYRFYKKLFEYAPPDATGWGWAEPEIAFDEGITAMDVAKGQFIRQFEIRAGVPPEDLGAAPVPWPENGQRGSLFYPNGIMILTENPEKREAVRKFLVYLYEPETYGTFVNMEPGLFVPVTETAFESKSYWQNPLISKYLPQVRVLLEANGYGRLFGFTTEKPSEAIGPVASRMLFAQGVQKMIVDDWTPEKAVKWVADEIREIAGE